jgi:hypothetical protein
MSSKILKCGGPELRYDRYGLKIDNHKKPGPENQALIIPKGDLLCWKFIDILKSQITKHK